MRFQRNRVTLGQTQNDRKTEDSETNEGLSRVGGRKEKVTE